MAQPASLTFAAVSPADPPPITTRSYLFPEFFEVAIACENLAANTKLNTTQNVPLISSMTKTKFQESEKVASSIDLKDILAMMLSSYRTGSIDCR